MHIGISPQSLSAIERGKTWPSVETLTALAKALETSTDYLLGLEDTILATRRPSWTDFVLWLLDHRPDQIHRVTQILHCSVTDLMPSSIDKRPEIPVAMELAALYRIPTLAIAIHAGYMDRDTALDALIDLMQWPWRKLAPYHTDWYNRHGGLYLRHCREAAGSTADDAIARWNALWERPLTVADWEWVEEHGVLRIPWDAHVPAIRLDELPGAWLWALVQATGVTPPALYADVVGLTALLGRLTSQGSQRRPWFAGHTNEDQLMTAFTQARRDGQIDVTQYRTLVQAIPWAIPDASNPASWGQSDPVSIQSLPHGGVRTIPILGRVVAGIPVEAQADQQGELRIPREDPGDFAVIVHGDSMVHAGITEGDVVIAEQVQPGQDVPPQSLVIALVNGEQTLKWLMRDTDGTWWLRAANPQYPDIPLDPQRDRVVGLVRGIKRRPPAPSSASSRPVASSDSWDDLTPDQRDLLAAQQQMIAEQQQLLQAMLVRFRRMNQAARSRASRPDDNDPQDPPF